MTTLRLGLTKVEIRVRTKDVRITHHGNMGNRIADVRDNVDRMLGKGVFDVLRSNPLKEYGSPGYEYMLVSPLETYMEAVGPDVLDALKGK